MVLPAFSITGAHANRQAEKGEERIYHTGEKDESCRGIPTAHQRIQPVSSEPIAPSFAAVVGAVIFLPLGPWNKPSAPRTLNQKATDTHEIYHE